jgi:DNA-binding NtrC family response regulator
LRFARQPFDRIVRPVEPPREKTIVIVDDEMSFTELLGSMLGEHFSCRILTFGNPLTAAETLPRLNVGVLVTDYYMPHINGLDLIRQAGNIQPAPTCILITGHSFADHDDETARIPHFKAILPKPFRWQQLARLIEAHWPAGDPVPLRNKST